MAYLLVVAYLFLIALVIHHTTYTTLEHSFFLVGIVARNDLNEDFSIKRNPASDAGRDDFSVSFLRKCYPTNSKIEEKIRELRSNPSRIEVMYQGDALHWPSVIDKNISHCYFGGLATLCGCLCERD
jgi:hypothetical protein